MKKKIAVILSFIFCIALCACGSDGDSAVSISSGKYKTLIQAIEDDDYMTALSELNRLFEDPKDSPSADIDDILGNHTFESGDEENEELSQAEQMKGLMENLVGEWYPTTYDTHGKIVGISEDGNWTLNGEECKWNMVDIYSSSAEFELTGKSDKYRVNVYWNTYDGTLKYSMDISVYEGESTSYLGSLYPRSKHEKVLNVYEGEWIPRYYYDDSKLLTFRKDGTCILGGEKATWEWDACSSDSFRLLINDNFEKQYALSCYYGVNSDDEEYYYINLYSQNEKGNYESEYEYMKADYFTDVLTVLDDEWIPKSNDDVSSVVIKADGSFKYGDNSGTWEIKSGNNSSLSLGLVSDSGVTYKLTATWEMVGDVKEEYDFTLYEVTGDDSKYQSTFYPKSNYEEVTITLDNWADYFELKEMISFSENSFGEVDYFSISRYMMLKPEYYDRLHADVSKVAYEYSKANTYYEFTIDPVTYEYQFGDITHSYDAYTTDGKMSHSWIDDDRYYGFYFDSSSGYIPYDGDSQSKATFEGMNRIQGILYLRK